MSVITDVLSVFTSFIGWIVSSMGSIGEIFYAVPTGGTEAELTIYGVLGCGGLAIGVVLLLTNKALDFFRFR